MTELFQALGEELQFRWTLITTLDVIDMLFVAAMLYLLFSLLRRSQAVFLVRGVLVLLVIFFTTTILVPLPTFTYLTAIAIVAIMIAVPITLQPELRQWLEKIGRTTFLSGSRKQELAEHVIPNLLRASENLSATYTGALIVLEGSVPLDDVITTGITINARLSAELLQTIFFDKTALHDGAVVIRDDTIVAAGCILPLTARELLSSNRRFGTRHRAAIGLSEAGDALTIVVSEETGALSVAYNGKFRTGLDSVALRQTIFNFYSQTDQAERRQWLPAWRRPSVRSVASTLGYILASIFLAVVLWLIVSTSSNPIAREVITDVPLTITDMQDDRVLAVPPPSVVTVSYMTTEEQLPNLSAESFSASASVSGLGQGKYRVPVVVVPDAEQVHVLGATPSEIDVTISAVMTATIPVEAEVSDTSQLSAAYMVIGLPSVIPSAVTVVGPQTTVERIARAVASVSIANAASTVRSIVPVRLLDQEGNQVTGITPVPANAEITVSIVQRFDAKDVGVRAVTTGTPPEGYWLSSLRTEPATVTLQGRPTALANYEGFIDTLPVDISEAESELRVQTPLDLAEGVEALDASGAPITTVTVIATVSERRGDIVLTLPIAIVGGDGMTVTVQPQSVDVLLSGPTPTLERIQADPSLVTVTVDVSTLVPGESREVTPRVVVPNDIIAQLVTRNVIVTRTVEP
ncbi:MAG: diadenylate cyclase CdaA [Anaerolineae bacterium]|nr:diadenylate cyclase CdaA [Anaerolineae bacterium]